MGGAGRETRDHGASPDQVWPLALRPRWAAQLLVKDRRRPSSPRPPADSNHTLPVTASLGGGEAN